MNKANTPADGGTDLGAISKGDIGKLLAPEGQHVDFTNPGGGSDSADISEDIDPEERLEELAPSSGEEEAGDEEGQADDDGEAEGDQGNVAPKQQQKQQQKASANAWAVKLQDTLRSKYGPELTLPTEGTDDELVEALEEAFTPRLHPDAVRLQQHLEAGGKLEDYFESRTRASKLLSIADDKEFMTEIYRRKYGKSQERPNGWDEERIKSVLSKREASGQLDIEALEMREQLTKEQSEQEKQSATHARGGAIDPADPQQVQKLHQAIEKSVEAVTKNRKMYGLDLSKAGTTKDIQNLAKYYLTPDAKGVTPYARKMAGNDNLIRTMLLLHMADNGLIDATLLEKANAGKMSVLKTISPKPRTAGGGKSGKPKTDMSRLSRPEVFS